MELILTPSGRLTVRQTTETPEVPATDGQLGRVAKSLALSQSEGLFLLATDRFEVPLPPAWCYWQELATSYLQALCLTPEIAGLDVEPIPPPATDQLAKWSLNVPPMPGAEYLSETVLVRRLGGIGRLGPRRSRRRWRRADGLPQAACTALAPGRPGLFPLGREPPRRDYPFAFLATYAPGVAGRRARPVSAAQPGPAGIGRRQEQEGLGAICSRPSIRHREQSALVKELVDSGDLYQPLAWTPREAYRFLKEVPVFEESGILVRLPDWWKKRPRPRVGVTIGDAKQKKFDAHGMLDFKVELALGDQELTEAEWRS